MKKLISIIMVFLLLFGTLAMAQEDDTEDTTSTFDPQDSYDWLVSQASGGAFDDDVFATSVAMLALYAAGQDTSTYETWLDAQLDETKYCYPTDDCNTMDTGMAMVALSEMQQDSNIDDLAAWLKDAQREADVDGNWLLEATTDSSGTCVLTYTVGENTYDVDIDIDAGTFTGCSSSTFYDLDSCLGGSVISNNPSIEMTLDCGSLESTAIMTHLYKSSNSYYLLDSEEGDLFTFNVNNGCFGRGSGDVCNIEASMYASWALEGVGADFDTLIYLREVYDSTDSGQNALMYLITEETTFLDDLAARQQSDGSFDRDAYSTGLAILAFGDESGYADEVDAAIAWLENNVDDSGGWGDVEGTAMALYAAFSDASVSTDTTIDYECLEDDECAEGETCESGECVEESEAECVENEDCSSDETCEGGICVEVEDEICVVNNNCETYAGENSENCYDDCFYYCGDGICDDGEDCEDDCGSSSDVGTSTSEPDDDDEGGSGWIWIVLIILIVALLGVVGFLAIKKGWIKLPSNFKLPFGKKKGQPPRGGGKPTYKPYSGGKPAARPARPAARPAQPSARPTAKPAQPATKFAKKSGAESDLDKSLDEARRLLGK